MRALLIALLPLWAATAHASVTYRWQGAGNGSGCCKATLVISDEAYAAGFFSTHIANDGAPQAVPANPVIRFELTAYGDRLIFERGRVRGFYDFEISVVGGALSGEIHANNLSSETLLSGTPTTWTEKAHHSDHPGRCFQGANTCAGDTGRWVLVGPRPKPENH